MLAFPLSVSLFAYNCFVYQPDRNRIDCDTLQTLSLSVNSNRTFIMFVCCEIGTSLLKFCALTWESIT